MIATKPNCDRLSIRQFTFAAGILSVFVVGAQPCSGKDATSTFRQENKPENLRALFELIHVSANKPGGSAQALTLFKSLFPDEAQLKKALKADVDADVLQKIVAYHSSLRARANQAESAKELARPEQKVVKVHGATTKELVQYQQGSVAHAEFPGGARKLAEQILRPGMTFYEVEFLEPGKDTGMKYHLIYWDGTQWAMVGPAWRALH
jgi:hypothetical protein